MIRIAICDDNIVHLKHAKQIVTDFYNSSNSEITVQNYSPLEFMEYLKQNFFCYDIVIMDIELSSEENGIELAQKINSKCPSCQIIFLSGYPKYLMDVYETEHIYFVYKKNIIKFLPKALSKAMNQLSGSNIFPIYINTRHGVVQLNLDNIIYAERVQRKTFLYTIGDTYVITETLNDFLSQCTHYPFLVRCHSSYIINLKYITTLTRTNVVLQKDISISISRKYITDIKTAFMNYLGKS